MTLDDVHKGPGFQTDLVADCMQAPPACVVRSWTLAGKFIVLNWMSCSNECLMPVKVRAMAKCMCVRESCRKMRCVCDSMQRT